MAAKTNTGRPVLTAIPFVLAGSLGLAGSVGASQNPFGFSDLPGGYMLAEQDSAGKNKEGKCGEGKCGGKSAKEAVCGMYQIGSRHEDESKVKDGKCGGHKAVEALCGGDR